MAERNAMITRTHALPVVRPCQDLGAWRVPDRGHDQATPVDGASPSALMRRIDELHLEHPFGGARMLSKMLKRSGGLQSGAAGYPP